MKYFVTVKEKEPYIGFGRTRTVESPNVVWAVRVARKAASKGLRAYVGWLRQEGEPVMTLYSWTES